MAKVMEALGMVETKGLVALIEASDAMLKAATLSSRSSATTSPAAQRVKKSTPTARTSGSAKWSSISRSD